MTIEELRYRQSWTLFQKIAHAVGVISQFHSRLNSNVYVSFSGGKDSTVLLDIVRRFIDPDCLAVFCNTGNAQTIRPKTSLRKIIEKYGFPLISKEQALYIRQAKHTKSEVLRNIRLCGKKGRNGKYLTQGAISKKWQYLINAPFDITEKCCYYLKKEPFKRFQKETGLFPIIGTMAEESRLRLQKWLKQGCNSFDSDLVASYPLSIFTEDDIWGYIRYFKIPYCPIYDDGETRTGCVVCGFGCHFPCDDRFYRLQKRKPLLYNSVMNYQNNGITFKEALQYCNIDFPDAKNKQLRLCF